MVINTKDRDKKNKCKEQSVNLEISKELFEDNQKKQNKNCFSCPPNNKNQ